MARTDGRIEPGQKLSTAISARAWNRAQQAADVVLGAGTGATGDATQNGFAPYTWVYAKNGTGSTIARWSVQSITGFEITPTSSESAAATTQFLSMPCVTLGARSSSSDTAKAWCVALEPIESNKLGRVAVSGVVQVKAADLQKASGCRVLFKDSNWALVDVNGGIVRGTFSGSWAKGATATVTDALANTVTYTAKNYWASVNCPTATTCFLAYVSGEWVLQSLDLTGLSGYSGSTQQVLTHDATGVVAWVSTTACS